MSYPMLADFGSYFAARYIGHGTATAGDTGDAEEVIGQNIDLNGFRSGSILIIYNAALSAAKTLSFTVKKQQSSDNSTYDTAETVKGSTVAATGAGTKVGVVKIDVCWEGDKRYQCINITPDLSAAGTDTCDWHALLIVGGAEALPAV